MSINIPSAPAYYGVYASQLVCLMPVVAQIIVTFFAPGPCDKTSFVGLQS